jgi:glycosyltransferase involved in cell wall biosynthesis
MEICYWGTYDRDYPRNRILMAALRSTGARVRECHFPLWRGTADKLRGAGSGWLRPGLWLRWLWGYFRLGLRFLASPRPDFLFVGYSGHFDVLPAWCLSRLRRVPLVFDAFLSLYDSFVLDRTTIEPGSVKARLLATVDRTACRLADRVLLDTESHRDFFCRTFAVPAEKIWVLPIGADETVFRPASGHSGAGRPFTVLHFGRYIPLHGLDTVVRAAAILEADGAPCRFLLVGDGEERGRIESLARELKLRTLEFRPAVAPERLAEVVQSADLCLGIFGRTGKAARVVPNKVYEAMAAGKPVITGDSPAAREMLTDGEDCLLCPMGDPQALAAGIRRVARDPALALRLAEAGRRRFERSAASAVIGDMLRRRLDAWRNPDERAA